MRNTTSDRDASYYRLHTDAIDDLVNATVENTPKYAREELQKYTSGRKGVKLSSRVKVFLIKAWFYGAVCYFVFWGMGLYIPAQLDLFVIAAVIMGMVTDLLINTLLRFMEKRTGESRAYTMIAKRGAAGFLLNLLYGGALMFLIVTAYSVINMLLKTIGGAGVLFLGVEPLGFGLIGAAADTLLIACRQMLGRIITDAKRR